MPHQEPKPSSMVGEKFFGEKARLWAAHLLSTDVLSQSGK
jgi:hypothetical protein